MVTWAVSFFIFSIVSAAFGFTGVAGDAATIAKALSFVFAVLTVVALISGANNAPDEA